MQTMNPNIETPTAIEGTATDGIATQWDIDGVEYLVVQSHDLPETTDAQVAALMVALECSELEAWYALRIIREDGEFVTSVSADIDDLPLTAA